MNDMVKIDYLTPEKEILRELGRRLARVRKQQGFSQEQLAGKSGIGVATLRRIEGGNDSQLESWLKLLKALQMTASIDSLLPQDFKSPMAEALAQKKGRRKRPGTKGIVWGDEVS
jgi:transcriptional regulator with XRE-family HTH domain